MSNNDENIGELICHLLVTNNSNNLRQIIFEPINPESVGEVKMWIRAFLTERLGDVIDVEEVQIDADDADYSVFCVTIEYVVRQNGKREVTCIDIAPKHS